MKKNLLIVWLLIIFVNQAYSQRVFDSITISDEAGGSKVLVFGLDSLATDGIDTLFGESDLPPFPPIGAFEARFFLPDNGFIGTLGSYSDFRNVPAFPFTGQKEFRLAYQVGTGTVIKIDWNFPLEVTGVLQDIIIGTLINVPMSGTGTYTVVNPAAFNRLKMLINYTGSIPVELVSFGASVSGTIVNLNWRTATELNNSGFAIQKKLVDGEWQDIGFVSGAGTSTEIHNYTFQDNLSETGVILYRLKQIDFDGAYSYSQEIKVDINELNDFNLNQNYPNPFNPSTTISFSIPKATNVTLTIFNQIGEKVDEIINNNLEAGFYNLSWNASKYSSGNYFYELKTDEYKTVRKMTLLK
jgi:hypothetical protein